MSKRRIGFIAAIGAASLLVFAAWLAEVWGGSFATKAVDDIGQLILGVFATVCCLLAARRTRGRQRAPGWRWEPVSVHGRWGRACGATTSCGNGWPRPRSRRLPMPHTLP